MPKRSDSKPGRQRVLSEATAERKHDPLIMIGKLLAQVIKKQGVRGTARVAGVPSSTIFDRMSAPAEWRLEEARRILESSAQTHRITVELGTAKAAPARKGRKPKVAAAC